MGGRPTLSSCALHLRRMTSSARRGSHVTAVTCSSQFALAVAMRVVSCCAWSRARSVRQPRCMAGRGRRPMVGRPHRPRSPTRRARPPTSSARAHPRYQVGQHSAKLAGSSPHPRAAEGVVRRTVGARTAPVRSTGSMRAHGLGVTEHPVTAQRHPRHFQDAWTAIEGVRAGARESDVAVANDGMSTNGALRTPRRSAFAASSDAAFADWNSAASVSDASRYRRSLREACVVRARGRSSLATTRLVRRLHSHQASSHATTASTRR